MRKPNVLGIIALLFVVLLILIFVREVHCQPTLTTNTTANVTDSDSQPWNNGAWSAQLYNPSGTQKPVYTQTGQPVPTLIQNQLLNNSGNLSYAFPDNNKITPPGTRWDITMCSNTSATCSQVTHVLITGTAIDISIPINTQIVAPRFAPGSNQYGYADGEVTSPVNGSQYWNVSRQIYRVYNGTAWNDGSGAVSGAPVNGAACVNAALGNVTNGLNTCIQNQIATGKRGTMMIDSTVGIGHPTVPLTSLNRVQDQRGSNCMDQFGGYFYSDNAFCTYSQEDKTDSTTVTTNGANYDFSYDSEHGGVYSSTNTGHGVKSNRANINMYSMFRTVAQNWGIYQEMEAFAGGELDPYQVFMEVYSGYLGYGQEMPTGFRAQQTSGTVNDGSGGVFKGTITNIASGVVTFTSSDPDMTHVRTLGEARIMRDLGNSYSTGSISVSCNSASPNICTVTGTGTAWTSITGFVGTHTTFIESNAAAGPIASNNLTLCFTPNANNGFDWCVPILQGISDTSLTLSMYNYATAQNAGWWGPTSGNYVIYHSCWPTAVSINVNLPVAGQNFSFSASDTSGLTVGDNFDQVESYNVGLLGGLILQSRDIGAPYIGGGWLITNYGGTTSPGFEHGIKVQGNYLYALESGAINGSQPSSVVGITQRGGGPIIFDTSPATVTAFTLFQYRDSNGTYVSPFSFYPNQAATTNGMCIYSDKFCITESGVLKNLRAGTWTITSSTLVNVTFTSQMLVAPTSCVVAPGVNFTTTGYPYVTNLSVTGFTVNVATSGTINGTYQCVYTY